MAQFLSLPFWHVAVILIHVNPNLWLMSSYTNPVCPISDITAVFFFSVTTKLCWASCNKARWRVLWTNATPSSFALSLERLLRKPFRWFKRPLRTILCQERRWGSGTRLSRRAGKRSPITPVLDARHHLAPIKISIVCAIAWNRTVVRECV